MKGNTVVDVDAIPAELKPLVAWIPWGDSRDRRTGKVAKTPRTRGGQPANANDPKNHYPLDTALKIVERLARQQRWEAWGVGLAVGRIDYVLLDYDHCGGDEDIAAEIAEMDTYAESSPSGDGFRVVLRGKPPRGLEGQPNLERCQLFATTGFATITGNRLREAPEHVGHVDRLPPQLDRLWRVEAKPALELPAEGDIEPVVLDVQLEQVEDRSAAVAALCRAQLAGGLAPEVLLASLVANEAVFEMALEHRRGSPDRARRYLWDHHVVPALSSATERDEFDVVDVVDSEPVEDEEDFLRIVDSDVLAEMARAPDWVVGQVIERGEVALLTGHTNMGKTFVAYDLAAHASTGRDWNGCATSGGPVLYLSGEGPRGFRRRARAFKDHRFDPGSRVMVSQVVVDLAKPETLKKVRRAALQAMKRRGHSRLDLVTVDTYSRYSSADENDNAEVARFLLGLQRLAQQLDCAILVLHHPKKDDENGAPRGAGAFSMNADVVLTATPWVVQGRERPGCKVLRLVTARDAPTGFEVVYRLDSVPLPWENETSALVVPVGQAERTEVELVETERFQMTLLGVLQEGRAVGVREVHQRAEMRERECRDGLDALVVQGLATMVDERGGRERWQRTELGTERLETWELLM